MERWESEEVPQPTVIGIYRIQLPVKFYNRFDGALYVLVSFAHDFTRLTIFDMTEVK